MPTLEEWVERIEGSWSELPETFAQLTASGQLDEFVENAEIERGEGADVFDAFNHYLHDQAIGKLDEDEWRPVIVAYEKLLRRKKREGQIDYWWGDLLECWLASGNMQKTVDLFIEMYREVEESFNHLDLEKPFYACLKAGDRQNATRLVEFALDYWRDKTTDYSNDLETLGRRFSLWIDAKHVAAQSLELAFRQHSNSPAEWEDEKSDATWPQVISLYISSGDTASAGRLCMEIGRRAKADRLSGKSACNIDEIDFPRGIKPKQALAAVGGYASTADAETDWLGLRRFGDHSYPNTERILDESDHSIPLGIALMYQNAKDTRNFERVLQKAEACYQNVGLWQLALGMYFDAGRLQDVERVAREEDEIECAIIAFEAAGKPQEAARIYEERAGGKPGRKAVASSAKASNASIDRHCPSCGACVEEDAKFCGDCGHRLSTVCPECGAELRAGKKFCKQCGSKVE